MRAASVSDGFHALLDGASTGIDALASLVMFLSFTALSLVFLLKDGPAGILRRSAGQQIASREYPRAQRAEGGRHRDDA